MSVACVELPEGHNAKELSEMSNGTAKFPVEAESIRTLRHNLRMTQEEFAHRLGITVATVNRWENGHNRPTRLARKALIALASQGGVQLPSTPIEG